jgi:hypothetical protein
MNKTEQHKKAMLAALEQSLGVVSEASRIAQIGRTTHYSWLESDPEYKEAVESIGESTIDFVESKLFQLINGVKTTKAVGDEFIVYDTPPCKTSIIFYLNNKGKKRGYNTGVQHQTTEQGEQAKITLPNGTQISI